MGRGSFAIVITVVILDDPITDFLTFFRIENSSLVDVTIDSPVPEAPLVPEAYETLLMASASSMSRTFKLPPEWSNNNSPRTHPVMPSRVTTKTSLPLLVIVTRPTSVVRDPLLVAN